MPNDYTLFCRDRCLWRERVLSLAQGRSPELSLVTHVGTFLLPLETFIM